MSKSAFPRYPGHESCQRGLVSPLKVGESNNLLVRAQHWRGK